MLSMFMLPHSTYHSHLRPLGSLLSILLVLTTSVCQLSVKRALAQDISCATWPRVLPPEGIEIPKDKKTEWEKRLQAIEKSLDKNKRDNWTDVEVLAKACRLAIQYREFYQEKDFAKCDRLLKLAEEKLNAKGKTVESGRVVRGFQSQVDGSVQPIGLILPEKFNPKGKKLPLYVWLHGRGDKATDLHFLCERLDKNGEVAPPDAITLHPFGRQCVGYKNAGSTDVMEAIDFVCANYPIDERRIVLIGFSMGGAGAWHLGAHYSDRFVAVSPGAGFAETARYQNLTPDKYPAPYVQKLWSVYDVPGYTRNLFNLPVIAYSGENDKQIQAARVMEEAFEKEGKKLQHLIGPGMGHKYHPDVLKDLLSQLAKIAQDGKPTNPSSISLQTHHLQFAKRDWIHIDGLQEQYSDTRVDASQQPDKSWKLTTKNVSRLELTPPGSAAGSAALNIDGQSIAPAKPGNSIKLTKDASGKWQTVDSFPAIRKHPGASGPIDDAFMSPFIFVTPTGKSSNSEGSKWVQCEMNGAIDRWTGLMRGAPRVKRDIDVTKEDMQKFNIVLWGDPESNNLIARLLELPSVPLKWDKNSIQLAGKQWKSGEHMPVMILPNPAAPNRYVVINSSITFREGHDRTNSLQNPQLPDWAVIGLDENPSAMKPGRIAAAGFFNDQWQPDTKLTW